MAAKQLPLSSHDYLTYPNIAHLFGLIADKPEAQPWIHRHFIQLVYFDSLRKIDFTNQTTSFFDPLLFDCPWLNIQLTHRDFIARVWDGSIVQFAIDSIETGSCVYFLADQRFIRESDAYGGPPHHHDMFIFGYDADAKVLSIADHLRGGRYIRTTCTFEEMELAYKNADGSRDWFDRRVMSVSFKPQTYYQYERHLEFDSLEVEHVLRTYVHSTKPPSAMFAANTYGIAVYDRVQEVIAGLGEGQHQADIRLLYVLREHKKRMIRRIHYMLEQGYLTNSSLPERYLEVDKSHEIGIGLLMKYNLTRDGSLLLRVRSGMKEAAALERELLEVLLSNIRHRPNESLEEVAR